MLKQNRFSSSIIQHAIQEWGRYRPPDSMWRELAGSWHIQLARFVFFLINWFVLNIHSCCSNIRWVAIYEWRPYWYPQCEHSGRGTRTPSTAASIPLGRFDDIELIGAAEHSLCLDVCQYEKLYPSFQMLSGIAMQREDGRSRFTHECYHSYLQLDIECFYFQTPHQTWHLSSLYC